MKQIPLILAVFWISIAPVSAQFGAAPKRPAGPRQVFVLHSGLHTILSHPRPDWAIDIIRRNLLRHGVAANDIVMLKCPFPTASWQDMFPFEGLLYYLDSMNPNSATSQRAYVRLDQVLHERGVGPKDKLVWIGHSAGGQVGLTMAHLGMNLSDYPELAKQSHPYHFDMVVTLGSPLGFVPVPGDVKQRYYFSPQDRVVRMACDFGSLALGWLGHRVHFMPIPSQLESNCVVRIFQGMEHPYWPDERVVARIIAESRKDYQPAWRSLAVSPSVGPCLSRLLCQALEEQFQLSLEDPFQ